MIAYRDSFVATLADDIERLVVGETGEPEALLRRLLELAKRNCPALAPYWTAVGPEQGVPDRAFKTDATYLFPSVEPELTFETSGTSGGDKGRAHYTPLGARLLRSTILAGARDHIMTGLERPAIVRFVPTHEQAPAMVMAYGMQLIEQRFGDPSTSGSVVTPGGIDSQRLERLLQRAIAADQPVVLIGGSFAFVNLCERLQASGKRWMLPPGSRMVDAGGFKGRSRVMKVDALRALMSETFGIDASRSTNIFGMTELASQLYDAEDRPLGPIGERPKQARPCVWPRLRAPHDMRLTTRGKGLLEVVDLCILDRPCVVLTGDLGVADGRAIALSGRASSAGSRGCSLTLDALTAEGGGHARA